MPRKLFANPCTQLLILLPLSIGTSACGLIKSAEALQPLDWVDQPVEQFTVTGTGGLDRLRNKPVTIGPFTANIQTQSPWGSLATTSTDDTTITIGDASKGGRELSGGTRKTDKDAELDFRLSGPAGELAIIRCRQILRMRTNDTRVTRGDGSNVFSMEDLESYTSSLNCQSGPATQSWPNWQMALSNAYQEPLQGTLTIDGVSYDLAGSKASTIGHVGMTVSYTVSRAGQTAALIDRSGDGLVSLRTTLSERQRVASIAAAVALLMANDPLQD